MSVTTTPPEAPGEPSGKGAQTSRAILDAAIARFGRDGYRATSVADIARDAGVGGTVTYAYFPNKEALFLAAVDADAAGVIGEGLSSILAADRTEDGATLVDWRQTLTFTMLEPEVTARVLEIPALAELRVACAERLRAHQASGRVRADLDPDTIANGLIAIILSLLMSMVQLGGDVTAHYADDVTAVFGAALDPPR